jgi:hypothetical protein
MNMPVGLGNMPIHPRGDFSLWLAIHEYKLAG